MPDSAVLPPGVLQGCAEIRWLAEKMGAKPSTVSGLSGLGDIMLTCYGSLSRNRYLGLPFLTNLEKENLLVSQAMAPSSPEA